MPPGKIKSYENLIGEPFYADTLFRDLSPKVIKSLSLKKVIKRFDQGIQVYGKSALPKGIYILLEGQAQLSFTDLCGKTYLIRLVKPNELIGLIELLANLENEITLETITPCLFEFISDKDFLKFLHNDSEICIRLLNTLSFNLQKSYKLLCSLS